MRVERDAKGLLDEKTLDALLQPEKLTAPNQTKEERGWI